MKSLKYLFVLLIAIFPSIACTQQLNFERISSEKGLFLSVNSIAQDEKGFIWIGTEFGLNRYDGYNLTFIKPETENSTSLTTRRLLFFFKDRKGYFWLAMKNSGLCRYDPENNKFLNFYANKSDASSLPDNHVTCIYEDKKNNLWIGTENGLALLNRSNNSFVSFRHYPTLAYSLSENNITTMNEDHQGNLWVGTTGGLNMYNHKTGKFKSFCRNIADPTALQDDIISVIFPDSKGELWIGTTGGSLNRIIKTGNGKISFQHFFVDPKLTYFESIRNIRCIIESRSGDLWIGTNKGVARLKVSDRQNWKFRHYLNDKSFLNPLSDVEISTIFQDHAGNIWTGSNGSPIGLCKYNTSTDRFDRYLFDPVVNTTISDNLVLSLFEDRTGVLWISTSRGGVCKLDLYSKPFLHFIHHPINNNSLNSSDVYSIFEDKKGIMWIGTAKGLSRFDRKTNTFSKYEHNPLNPSSIRGSLVGSIAQDPAGFLWLGYFDGQLSRFYPENGKVINYIYNPLIPGSSVSWSVRKLLIDRHGKLWLAAATGGLGKLNDDGSTFSYYMPDPPNYGNPRPSASNKDGINDIFLQDLYQDQQGILWIATQTGGLNLFDPATGKFIHFMNNPADKSSLSNNEVSCILNDVPNKLWLGTYGGGLNYFDKITGKCKIYSTKNGLPSNTIIGVIKDEKGDLWISTLHGLAKFDPKTGVCRNYTVEDGLQSNDFNQGAYYKSRDGMMWFGGINGLTAFYPASIKDNPHLPAICITNLKLFNHSITVGDTINGKILLPKALPYLKKIVLTYRDYDFTLEFAALHYAAPQKCRYQYILKGYDEYWKTTDSHFRYATYSGLKPGKYEFRVKASNNDGVWNENPETITIVVLPPWWKTLWFELFVILMLAGSLIIMVRMRIQNLTRQRDLLEARVVERTLNLQKANEELITQKKEIEKISEKLHTADELKLKFFINISHELRTPLTLILGPIEKILDSGKDLVWAKWEKQFKLVQRNALRMLLLVNQLLDIRKFEEGKMSLNLKYKDLASFVKETMSLFTPLAEERSISFSSHSSEEPLLVWFDEEKMDKILFNLLSNAFKFTPKEGSIKISLNYSNNKENILLKISDSGPGIEKEQLSHIFDRFYHDGKTSSSLQESTGIGLSLTRDLIELHKGKIEVDSVIGQGTSFIIYLPLGKDHSTNEEITESEPFEEYPRYHQRIAITPFTEAIKQTEPYSATESLPLLLLVEDNADVRSFLADELKDQYAILEAHDGLEGLKLTMNKIPDIIVSDILMPNMNGIELCQKIKNDMRSSHIPVILLTALSSEEKQLEGYSTGADDYMMKPVNLSLLKARITNIFANRQKIFDHFSKTPAILPSDLNIDNPSTEFINRVVQLIESNISDTSFTSDILQQELGMSRTNLYRKLKSLSGMSVNIFIRTIRLKKAAQLIQNGKYNVSQVAYECGFEDPKYFSECFRDYFHVSPSKFIQK
jgi:signal transduction histidine kinase/ligand-binding sensor domain-containing protein/DNA-binding response OmpR family regulator